MLRKHLDQTHNGASLMQRYMDLMHVSINMKRYGVLVSEEAQNEHRWRLYNRLIVLMRNLIDVAKPCGMPSFNPDSHPHVRKLLLGKLGAKALKYTPEGAPSTDKEVLEKYITDIDPNIAVVAKALLEYRNVTKLLSTYVNGLTGVIHPSWMIWGTRTGRWSAQPGVQTIPKPVKKDDKVVRPGLRNIFRARPGKWWVKADYAQLEVRIIAMLANDLPLLEAYAEGRDIHEENAIVFFGEELAKANPKYFRLAAKLFVYGCNYGAQPLALWERLAVSLPGLSSEKVANMMKVWFEAHSAIRDWQETQLQNAKLNSYIEAPLSGRRQWYQDGKIDVNEIYNFPVQGTGADIIDPAIIAIDRELDWDKEGILLQVHDEINLEVEDPVRGFRLLKDHMESEVVLNGQTVKFPVDVEIGRDWANLTEVKSEADVRRLCGL